MFAVDCKGLSGGLLLLWKSTLKVEIQNFSRRHINAIIHPDDVNGSPWKFTGFYGHLDATKRSEGWSLLCHLSTLEPIPWLCFEDYNEILATSEMSRPHSHARSQMEMFQKTLERCRLQELGFRGPKFTWTNGRQGADHTLERLDRALANMEWCELFDVVEVSILARICCDHNPVHVVYSTSSAIKWNKRRQFRFEADWLVQREPRKIIRQEWRTKPPSSNKWCDVGKRLLGYRRTLQQWVRKQVNSVEDQINAKSTALLALQSSEGTLEMKKKLILRQISIPSWNKKN